MSPYQAQMEPIWQMPLRYTALTKLTTLLIHTALLTDTRRIILCPLSVVTSAGTIDSLVYRVSLQGSSSLESHQSKQISSAPHLYQLDTQHWPCWRMADGYHKNLPMCSSAGNIGRENWHFGLPSLCKVGRPLPVRYTALTMLTLLLIGTERNCICPHSVVKSVGKIGILPYRVSLQSWSSLQSHLSQQISSPAHHWPCWLHCWLMLKEITYVLFQW